MHRSFLLAALFAPSLAMADQLDPMVCDVSVQYKLNSTVLLSYAQSFVVAEGQTFFDDFSTATRLRSFDASVSYDGGTPVVAFHFDADVSVFNAVAFSSALRVADRSHGETISGESDFFSSVPGAAGSHRTFWTVTCERFN